MAENDQLQVRSQQQLAPMRSLDELMEIAKVIVARKWCQEGETAEDVALRMLKGQDEGLTPMQALEHVYTPSPGKPASDSKVLVAKYRQAGHAYVLDEWTDQKCAGRFILADGTVHEFSLTMADVEKFGWNRSGNNGRVKFAWAKTQKIMLKYRWLSTGIRAFAPGIELRRVGDPRPERQGAEGDADLMAIIQDQEEQIAQLRAEVERLRAGQDDDVIDAEAREVTDEPIIVEPATNGRPYAPELVRARIQEHIARSGFSIDPRTASEQQVKAVRALLAKLFPACRDDQSLAMMRHAVMTYLTGQPSTTEMSAADASAIITWAIVGGEGPDKWDVKQEAVQEAALIVQDSEAGQGQEALPF